MSTPKDDGALGIGCGLILLILLCAGIVGAIGVFLHAWKWAFQ